MSGTARLRRGEAELDPGAATSGCPGIGNRSIHQFWNHFSAHFRGVLLPPRRRADSGKIAWSWREPAHNAPVTSAELADVRRRLTQASRTLTGGAGQGVGARRIEDDDEQDIEAQVRARVEKMAADLVAKSDAILAGYIGRDEAGPMLHSWGAAVPAKPSYPDARQAEVSGRVVSEGSDASDLVVVLENKSGLGVARAKTDRAGAFRFPGIAPGNYRLCVPGRPEFPAEGLPIMLEQESLTDLELRAITTARPVPAPKTAEPGHERRRYSGLLVLLALLLAGSAAGWWWYRRPEALLAAPANVASGWQSAQGSLAAPAEGPEQSESGGARESVHRLELSGKVSAPKLVASPAQREAGAADAGGRRDVTAVPGHDTPDGKLDDKLAAPMAVGTPGLARPQLETAAPSPNEPAAAPSEIAPSASLDDGGGEPSVSIAHTSRAVPPAGDSVNPTDAVETEALAPATRLFAKPEARATDAKGASESPVETLTVAPVTGRAVMPDKTFASSPLSAPVASRLASGVVAATDGLAASAGSRRRERMGATAGAGAEVVAAGGEPGASASALAPMADPDELGVAAVGSAASESTVATDKTEAGTKRNTPPKSPSDITPPDPTDASPIAAAGDASRSGGSVTAGGAGMRWQGDNLIPQGRISSGTWKARLLQDAILPTLPVPEGRAEQLHDLRSGQLRQRQSAMPATIAAPVVWSGFALDISGLRPGNEASAGWRVAAGGSPAALTARDGRAEITWNASGPERGAVYVLGWPGGPEIARISVDANGRPSVKAAAGVRTWYWIGAERSAADQAGRFRWEDLSGAPLPAGWSRDDRWREGRGMRLDIPLRSSGKTEAGYVLALSDAESGWALTCRIGVQ